ncbi:hypothetical protein J6590_048777 [Homalodisca vitripennis]|nr:hypothetical protein J6590_048777 [Homalodisca vitripennis]
MNISYYERGERGIPQNLKKNGTHVKPDPTSRTVRTQIWLSNHFASTCGYFSVELLEKAPRRADPEGLFISCASRPGHAGTSLLCDLQSWPPLCWSERVIHTLVSASVSSNVPINITARNALLL